MVEMFNYANSLDIYDQYAQVVTQNKFTADLSKRTNSGYANRKHHNHYVNSQDDIYARYGESIIKTVYISGSFGDIGYFINTDTVELMDEIVAFIQAVPTDMLPD